MGFKAFEFGGWKGKNLGAIKKAIDETGYPRYVGLEFWPVGDTEKALRQVQSLATG